MEPIDDIDMEPLWYPEYDTPMASYITEGSGSFSINQIESDPLVIKNMNSELIFKITSEGQIVIGDGYTPSAAADEFISRMRIRLNTKDHEYITQLESAIEAWKENLNDY
jgi:hypothetical protein